MATNGGSRVSRPPQQNGHRTAHSLPRDDHHDPYAPPPSTLAAIANIAADLPSLAASHRQYQACDDEEAPSFRLLLLELSRQGEDPNTAKSYEGLVEYNHKLVYAVVKAVIEPLTRDGAGGVNETVLDKASEGLSVLITTVTETPEVLGYVPKEEGKRVVPIEVPLWLWLFPRVLPLLGRRGCTELDERVEELFHECFTTTARSLRVGYLNGYFMLYLRYCADVALNHLRTSPAGEPLVLPPEGLEEAISHDEHGDLFLEDCTYVLEEQRYVRRHCWYLLHLFVRTALATVKLSTGSSTIQGHAIWVLDGYFLMFELERTQSLVCNVKASELEFYVTAAGAIRSLLISSEQRLPSAALQKGFSILALYCTQLAAESSLLLDKVTEQEFCRCLYEVTAASQQYPAVYQSMQAGLIPACQNLYDSVTRTGLEESLIEMALKPLAHHFDLAVQREPNAHSAQKEGDLAKLSNLGDYLGLYTDDITAERPPNKKRKTGDRDGQLIGIINKLHTLLGLEIHSEAARDLDGLANITSASFDHLDEHHRTDVIRYLGFLPCSSAGFLKVVNDRDQNISGATCEVCVGEQSVKAFHGPIATSAVGIFVALIGSSKFQEYKRLRVMAMIALRSYAMHFNDTRLLDLRESPLGQWCVGSLQSSVRELRIAAGRTLAAFLRESIEDEILQKNRVDVLEFLQLMSESAPAHQEETCIMAWGQIARTLKDLQFCMALERIVQYLGHANQLISSIAFTQILDLAKAKDISVETMLKPHWRTIGPIVVKDLQSRPQIAQLMADLLNISVSELLLNIQADILPWLVLYKKKDVIARIAHARKEDEPGLACIDDANIGPILALLLSQSAPDLEEFALTSLRDITPFFDDLDFQDLLKSGPYSIAVELLKNAGEADDSRKSRVCGFISTLDHANDTSVQVRLALNFLSRRADNGILASQYGKRGHHIGLFLERHILPIMFHFTNLINDTGFAQTSPEEKRRSIKGIEEMLWVGRGYIRSAIPQVRSMIPSMSPSTKLTM
jgi:serine/threonine-protein kinase ATR